MQTCIYMVQNDLIVCNMYIFVVKIGKTADHFPKEQKCVNNILVGCQVFIKKSCN